MAKWVEHPSPSLIDHRIRTHVFEPWSNQIYDLKIDAYRFIASGSVLLGYSMDWLAKCQDNVYGS